MNLVIDTNVMLESISSRSPYYQIFKSLRSDQLNYLIVSNEILFEYYEIFQIIFSKNIMETVSTFFNESRKIIFIDPHYKFNLITVDPDDNKFVDTAICGNADYLISSDNSFNVLKDIQFPKVKIIKPDDFINKYL